MTFQKIGDAVPIENAGMAPVVNRVMVTGGIYHTQGGMQPVAYPIQYSRPCTHTEQAFVRVTQVEPGKPISPGYGYLEGMTGEVMVQNMITADAGPQRLSPEAQKQRLSRMLRVTVGNTAFLLAAGQCMFFRPEDPNTAIRVEVVDDKLPGAVPVRIVAVPL